MQLLLRALGGTSTVALEVAPDVRLRALAARSVQAACKGISVCMYV